MRALILSDIHGSAIAARQALAYFEKLECDKIFLLGDTLYHGPRNPLPEGHGPMGVVEAFKPFADKVIAVRGNCDADVDLMMLDYFHIEDEYAVVNDNGYNLFLSHGHIFEPYCFPANAMDSLEPVIAGSGKEPHRKIDAYLFGHTHIWKLERNFKGVLLVNPGSTSLPKGGNPATFGFYADGQFSIRNLSDGSEIGRIRLNDIK